MQVDEERFTKGELKEVRFGLVARNMRMAISSLRIRGMVDTDEL